LKYKSGAAFRRALEERLSTQYAQTGVPLNRLRKLIAFDRFIARLMAFDPDQWVLKGGLLVQIHIGEQARTTKDIDFLALNAKPTDLHNILLEVGRVDLHDWFSFEVSRPAGDPTDRIGGVRFNVTALLDSRIFEQFHLDVNTSDVLFQPAKLISIPNYLDFAELPTTKIRCYTVDQVIAEKVHALTREYASGEASRVKDLIDILLLAGIKRIKMDDLRNAVKGTYRSRKTQKMPTSAPQLNRRFFSNYNKLAKEVGVKQKTADEGNQAIITFLSPVLSGESFFIWDPKAWTWRQ
jgi:hypothetical protein